MTSRKKKIAGRSTSSNKGRAPSKNNIGGGKHKLQCEVCGHRFSFWHKRAPDICRPCGELAFEIARVAGPEFVTEKAVLSARARQMLPQQVLDASTVAPQVEIQS